MPMPSKPASFVLAFAVPVLALGLGGAGPGCQPPPPPPVAMSPPEQLVPSPALPPEVVPQTSNNNLDVVEHDGELFFAFRTAPTHFASTETHLYVMSSPDGDVWQHEATFAMGTDLREPRFLSWNGQLWLFFAVLGKDPLDFEPQGTMVSRYEGPGRWSEPEPFYEKGFIPWRAKVLDGVPYIIGYVGGENIYDPARKPIYIHWLTTADGVDWEPVVPGQPVVQTGGGSETDFVFLDDGALIAVQRNEKGDELGWGSKICRAEPGALGQWQCVGDPRKFDSPLLFRQGADIWLVARRNLNGTGNYDLGLRDLTPEEQTNRYEVDYSTHRKRCSLWKVDPDLLKVDFVQDLPSKGDTCFPSMLRMTPQSVELYNYSSPVYGADLPWIGGQLNETRIYRMLLTFRDGSR
jgi:hypothetical protein